MSLPRPALRADPETLVLAALLGGPRHEYALLKALDEALPPECPIGGGQVHAALRALEAGGWVVGEWRGERRLYRLTDPGRADLARRAAEWRACADAVDRLLPVPA